MAVSVSTVRQAVVEAVSALTGWVNSRFAPDLFGRDTDGLSHHAFSVGCPDSSVNSRDGKQGLSDGFLASTTVEVRWAHRLHGDAQSDDYDNALDAEEQLVQAVVGISSEHVLVTRLARKAVAEGWILGTATFSAVHRYPLS